MKNSKYYKRRYKKDLGKKVSDVKEFKIQKF